MSDEPRKIFLGVIEDAEGIGLLDVPLNGSVEQIRAAIAKANAAREAERLRETQRLRAAMGFLPEAKADAEQAKARPVGRDWLLP